MPGFFLHVGATVMCAHGGQAQPTVPNPRVMVSGQPIGDMAAPYVVAGCPFTSPARRRPVRHGAVGERAPRGLPPTGMPRAAASTVRRSARRRHAAA